MNHAARRGYPYYYGNVFAHLPKIQSRTCLRPQRSGSDLNRAPQPRLSGRDTRTDRRPSPNSQSDVSGGRTRLVGRTSRLYLRRYQA